MTPSLAFSVALNDGAVAAEHAMTAPMMAVAIGRMVLMVLFSMGAFPLDIIQDHSMIPIEFLRRFREPAPQFFPVAGVEPNEHRLVILFGFIPLALEPAKEWVTGLPGTTSEFKLGLPLSYANETDQVQLIVLFQRPS